MKHCTTNTEKRALRQRRWSRVKYSQKKYTSFMKNNTFWKTLQKTGHMLVAITIYYLIMVFSQHSFSSSLFQEPASYLLDRNLLRGVDVQSSDQSNSFSSPSLIKSSPNLHAKLTYGNQKSNKRGIKNIHLNVRSIRNKLCEVRNIILNEKPHIFGLSECELRKGKI